MSIYKFLFLSLAVFTFSGVFAQLEKKPAFYDDIMAFKNQDSLNPPPKGAILFIGSSSFTKWKTVQEMFPGYSIINRGFGGSSLPDITRYANSIIFPYEPQQIVIYCGENDVASGADSKVVSDRFKTLFLLIRKQIPGIPIVFISMKPSPSREKFAPVVIQGNQIIKNFLWTQGNSIYVDVYKLMLDENGKNRPELFIEDMLHMNQDGYKIWQQALLPYLKK